nr:MAG TPA: hypothetical protein [Caudoviricetes sp.]
MIARFDCGWTAVKGRASLSIKKATLENVAFYTYGMKFYNTRYSNNQLQVN